MGGGGGWYGRGGGESAPLPAPLPPPPPPPLVEAIRLPYLFVGVPSCRGPAVVTVMPS